MGAKLCAGPTNWEETYQFEVYKNDIRYGGRPHIWPTNPKLQNGQSLQNLEEIKRSLSIDGIEQIDINNLASESSSEEISSSFKQTRNMKNLAQKEQKQEVKLRNEESENFQSYLPLPRKGCSVSAFESYTHLSPSQECFGMADRAEVCEHNFKHLSCSKCCYKSSNEVQCFKKRRMDCASLVLGDLPSGELKFGYSCSWEKKSTTPSQQDDDFDIPVADSESSYTEGQGSSPWNKCYHIEGYREIANIIKEFGLDSYNTKYGQMGKTDAPSLFSLSLYELIQMGVLEWNGKGILTLVHPVGQDCYKASDNQLPDQYLNIADSEKHSCNEKNWPAAQPKQLHEPQIMDGKFKQQITELEATVTKQKIENESLAKECEDLWSTNKALNDQILQISDNLMAQTERAEKCKEDLDQCVAEVVKHENTLENIRVENKKQKIGSESLAKECEDLRSTNKALNAQILQISDNLMAQTKRAEKCKEDLDQCVAEVVKHETTLENIRVENKKQKTENESLAKECEDLRSKNKTLNAKILQISDNYMAQTERAEQCKEDLDQCVAKVVRLETTLENIRVEKNKKQKIENESLAKECEDLRSMNKALNAQILQITDECITQTELADLCKEDLDQCVAEVVRLETTLENISVEKNMFWEELQLKSQKCLEQKRMLINLRRKYSNEVNKLEELLNSKSLGVCMQGTDSDNSYAFDDTQSESEEFFADGHDMEQELEKLKSQDTERDEKEHNSQDNTPDLLQSMTNSSAMNTDISFSDKEQAGQEQSTDYNSIIPFADTSMQNRDMPFVDQNWFLENSDDVVEDVSISGSASPILSPSSTHSDIASKEEADIPLTLEPMIDSKSSSSGEKIEQVSFLYPKLQLSPRTLSSLMLFNEEVTKLHQTTSSPSSDTTASKPSYTNISQPSQYVSNSVEESAHKQPETQHLEHSDAQRTINTSICDPSVATQGDFQLSEAEPEEFSHYSSPKNSDSSQLCRTSDEVSSTLKLVEFVAECLRNVEGTEPLISWNAFLVTLSKHFSCSNEVLRSVFDQCNSYDEEKISVDDFKEKLQSDFSDAFVLFRNAFFNHTLLVSKSPFENDSSGFLVKENGGVQASSQTKTANGDIFDSHHESFPAEKLGNMNKILEDLSIKLNVLPRGCPFGVVEGEPLFINQNEKSLMRDKSPYGRFADVLTSLEELDSNKENL